MPNRRFTLEQIAEVRSRAASGEPRKNIAADFGMSHGYVSIIVNGRSSGNGSSCRNPSMDDQSFSYRWTPGRKQGAAALPVSDTGFIRPPTKQQLMGGR